MAHVIGCGVCHTELDEIEGRTPPPNLPVVLGHQVRDPQAVARVQEVVGIAEGVHVALGARDLAGRHFENVLEGAGAVEFTRLPGAHAEAETDVSPMVSGILLNSY